MRLYSTRSWKDVDFTTVDLINHASNIPKHSLSATQKSVLIQFLLCVNPDGSCNPSVKWLAHRSSLSRRTVQRVIQELWNKKFISSIETGIGNKTPVYTFDLNFVLSSPDKIKRRSAKDKSIKSGGDTVTPPETKESDTEKPPEARGGDTESQVGVSESHVGGDTVTPKQIKNKLYKQKELSDTESAIDTTAHTGKEINQQKLPNKNNGSILAEKPVNNEGGFKPDPERRSRFEKEWAEIKKQKRNTG